MSDITLIFLLRRRRTPRYRRTDTRFPYTTLFRSANHDDRSQSDERAVLQRATMQHGHVADQHVFANDSGKAPRAVLVAIAMDDGAALDFGASADTDMYHTRADTAIITDARIPSGLPIPKTSPTGGSKGTRMGFR